MERGCISCLFCLRNCKWLPPQKKPEFFLYIDLPIPEPCPYCCAFTGSTIPERFLPKPSPFLQPMLSSICAPLLSSEIGLSIDAWSTCDMDLIIVRKTQTYICNFVRLTCHEEDAYAEEEKVETGSVSLVVHMLVSFQLLDYDTLSLRVSFIYIRIYTYIQHIDIFFFWALPLLVVHPHHLLKSLVLTLLCSLPQDHLDYSTINETQTKKKGTLIDIYLVKFRQLLMSFQIRLWFKLALTKNTCKWW